jgi:NADH-quinone oxidoreductase subunit N
MASANDLIVLFLGIEVLSLAVYVLAAYHLRRIESQEAALKYFILGAFASAFLLYGIALVYGAVGSTNLSDINAWLAQNILVEDGLLLAGLAMLLVGLGFKVAAAPFHAWTPDVYQGAPSPVVAWMAAGVKAAGFAALLRVFVTTFGSFSADWRPAMAVLAGASVLVGSLGAALQTDVKRLLAYSSVAHAGFLLIGVEAATARGTSAVFSYLAIYALLAIGSFAVVTLMGGSGDQNHQLEVYHGLGARQPWLAGAFTVLLLAQAGVPLTAGFVAKFGVIAAAADAGSWWLASVAMLATAIAAFAYLRVVVAMYLNDSVSDETITVDRTTCWVISVVVALVMLIGLMPSILLDVARQAVPVLVGG